MGGKLKEKSKGMGQNKNASNVDNACNFAFFPPFPF